MTLPSVSAVACDFPGNLSLLSLKYTKRLSHSHTEYSVVHGRDLGILSTPGSFGELQDSLTLTPAAPLHFSRLWLCDSVVIALSLVLCALCCDAISHSSWPCLYHCRRHNVTCQLENERLLKIFFLWFMGKKELRRGMGVEINLRGGLSGGSVGCRYLLQ